MDSLPEGAILAWNFIASNGMTGEGHHVRDTYKALELQPAGLTFSVKTLKNDQFEIDVTATGLALFVMLEADQVGRYSDNLFDLAAGETRRIIFTPKTGSGQPQFRIFDLHTCQSSH
jgi:beta-mannosidase